MEELNQKVLAIGRNIFKQLEVNEFKRNIVIAPEDAKLLFQYIFALEKSYDKLKEDKEPKEKENVEA